MDNNARISVTVDLVYKHSPTLRSTYNIDWNSHDRDFETLMQDLMTTLMTFEDIEELNRIDIIDIVAITATIEEKECIREFMKSMNF